MDIPVAVPSPNPQFATPPPVSTNVPPPVLNLEQKPKSSILKKILLVFVVLIILVGIGSASGYFFYYLPRKNVTAQIAQITDKSTSLRGNLNNLNVEMKKIANLALGNSELDTGTLKISGLMIHPELASIMPKDGRVLGVKSAKEPGFFESAMLEISQNLLSAFQGQKTVSQKVAGVKTVAESASIAETRKIKDKVDVAKDVIKDANSSNSGLSSIANSLPKSVIQNNEYKEVNDNQTNFTKSYLDEATKITNYYDDLSSNVITLELKVSSYVSSSAVSAKYIDKGFTEKDALSLKNDIVSAQSYLTQGSKDNEEIKKILVNINLTNQDKLPKGSEDYIKHNSLLVSKTLDAFTKDSVNQQAMIDKMNSMQKIALTRNLSTEEIADVQQFYQVYISKENQIYVEYYASIRSLLGEELALATSFWQNNGLLASGSKVDDTFGKYQKMLDKIKDENKTPF